MNRASPASIPPSPHFSNEHLSGDLKRTSVRGGAATFAGQGVRFVLNLGSTMVLARILSPHDFGLIAMVMAVTSFIMVFKDLGLSMATVQRFEINHGQVSTLFWINIIFSVLLMLITLALAPAVAWFYKDPRLVAVTAALSTALLFGGMTVQHQALLRRQMRLSALTTIDVLSMAGGILTAILCAWRSMGYWSLVWMQIVTAFINAVGVWLVSGWIPGRPVRRAGVRSMIAFGGYLTAFSFVNYFARNFDNVLIGRFSGAQSLGFYSRAYSLLLFPIGQIVAPMTSAAVPALSQLQNDPIRYRNYYLKGLNLIAYLTFPLVIALAILSAEVVELVLGKQWMDAVPIFRVLAITAMFQPIVSTVGWIYISLGQTRRMAIWGVVSSVFIVGSFLIGIRWGAFGVAASYAVCQVLLAYPCFSVAMAKSPLTPIDVFSVTYRPICLSLCFGTGMVAAKMLFSMSNPVWISLLAVSCGCVFGCAVLLAWPSARRDFQGITSIISILFERNRVNRNANL